MNNENLPLLQVMERLLCPVETLQVLHHLLHVLLGVAVLDVGEPAAAHADDDGHHQHEVLEVVVTGHCKRPRTLLESKDHCDRPQRAWPAPQGDRRAQGSLTKLSYVNILGENQKLGNVYSIWRHNNNKNMKFQIFSSNLPGSKWYRGNCT